MIIRLNKVMRLFYSLMCLLTVLNHAEAEEADVFRVRTEGNCRMATAASARVAKAVAMYNARREAVEIAGWHRC
jgi:hypothetical protein